MEELLLGLRFMFAFIFISSAVSKLNNMNAHEIVIEEYRILPSKWCRYFARLDGGSELLIGMSLFFGIYDNYASIAAIILLVLYSLGIGINVNRVRTNLSCGCGGLVGNDKLSWYLVTRNLIFSLILVILVGYPPKLFSATNLFNTGDLKAYFTISIIPVIISVGLLIAMYLNFRLIKIIGKNIQSKIIGGL